MIRAPTAAQRAYEQPPFRRTPCYVAAKSLTPQDEPLDPDFRRHPRKPRPHHDAGSGAPACLGDDESEILYRPTARLRASATPDL